MLTFYFIFIFLFLILYCLLMFSLVFHLFSCVYMSLKLHVVDHTIKPCSKVHTGFKPTTLLLCGRSYNSVYPYIKNHIFSQLKMITIIITM